MGTPTNTHLQIKIYALGSTVPQNEDISSSGIIVFDENTQRIGINGSWFGLDTKSGYETLKTTVSNLGDSIDTLNGSGAGSVAKSISDALVAALGVLDANGKITTTNTGINLGENISDGTVTQFLAALKTEITGITNSYVARDKVSGEGHQDYANTTAIKTAIDAAQTAAESTVIGTNQDTASSDTVYGAKAYAKGLVDALLGEDSANTTLATLKQVIAELSDPANQGGITGTFVDTVKTAITGLTKDDGQGGTTTATVKEYVDNAVANASSGTSSAIAALDAEVTSSDGTNVQVKVTEVDGKITAVNVTSDNTVNASYVTTAIAALDATPAQTAAANNGQLELSLTQVDGVVTGISGSIAANTYDAYGAAAGVLGTSSDASTANTVYGAKAYVDEAKSTVIGASGDASTANTIYGAKAYADAAVTALGTSTITNGVLTLPF